MLTQETQTEHALLHAEDQHAEDQPTEEHIEQSQYNEETDTKNVKKEVTKEITNKQEKKKRGRGKNNTVSLDITE